MSTHFIYHIIGKKVGCTKHPKTRLRQQRHDLPYAITFDEEVLEGDERIEVLVVLTDVTDERAAQIERAFQRLYGYRVDSVPYTANWSRNITREQFAENARRRMAALTPEQRRENWRRMQAAVTPEQHSENCRKAGRASAARFTPEEMSERMRGVNAGLTPEESICACP
jgi:hypothetical protein